MSTKKRTDVIHFKLKGKNSQYIWTCLRCWVWWPILHFNNCFDRSVDLFLRPDFDRVITRIYIYWRVNFTGCSSLQSIHGTAFYKCEALASVNLTGCSSLTSIGERAFSKCVALESIDFTGCSSLTTIEEGAFLDCLRLAIIFHDDDFEFANMFCNSHKNHFSTFSFHAILHNFSIAF